ncbi:phosphotransferase [Kineococcus sp. R8]|nr:phosphotransferase [Kineococcus siccus]
MAAATSTASGLGLAVERVVLLHDANALTLRLLPCDVVARVAPVAHGTAAFQLDVAGQLAAVGAPVAAPDPRVEPRVHTRDGLDVTFWTHHAAVADVSPAACADALQRLHAGLRSVRVAAPHVTDRLDEARNLVADRTLSPELGEADRDLLAAVLDAARPLLGGLAGREQLLHGEPHPGNVLGTAAGPVVVDWETCCRGPVEFDLAHAPAEVAAHYPGADPELLRRCRTLALALATTWRWDRHDTFPDGRRAGRTGLDRLRETTGGA